ncbi:M23 family metallopeptidase [Laspinema sp. D1]|uniref:M23 family metallopeptidase n=1 Tax=Laspinema palackyanum D2a TaxID=2953684 RepID=A0ABT2N1X4_9CYAN|nr:M23 family metallopeptidase [Laspinema sp. D2a]
MNNSNLETTLARLDQKIDAIANDLDAQWEARKAKATEGFVLFAVIGSCGLLAYHHALHPLLNKVAITPTQQVIGAIAPDLEKPVKGGDKIGQFELGMRDFGYHKHPIHGYVKFHNGIDLGQAGGLPENSQLYAPGTGTKTKVTCLLQASGAGLYAILEPDNLTDRQFMAMHLNKCAFKIGESGYLKPGEVFGLSGGDPAKGAIAGTSTGPHLHWSEKKSGEWVVPKYWPLFQVLHGQLPSPPLSRGGQDAPK